MRALVTGAAGFLGRRLVRTLVDAGHEVRALVRSPGGEGSLAGPGVEVVRGDVGEPGSLRGAVAGCDWVFHLAGVRRGTRLQDFLAVNAEGTRNALEACVASAPGLSRFVLAGSITASGPSASGRREEDPLEPMEWMGASKAEAERIAWSYRDRIPVAVARPPRVTGPGDRENLLFFRLARRGLAIGVAGPPRPLSFVDVEDCVRGLVLLAEHPAAVGEAFFLAHPDRTDLLGLQIEAARALGVKTRVVRVPEGVIRAAGAGADVASRILGRHLPFNRKLADQILAPGWTCDTAKARRLLGFEARTPLAESVGESARWYAEMGWL